MLIPKMKTENATKEKVLTSNEEDVLLALALNDGDSITLVEYQTAENEDALPGLLAKGLIEADEDRYGLTDQGVEIAKQLIHQWLLRQAAEAYRAAAKRNRE
jgi:predicted methyltransferase